VKTYKVEQTVLILVTIRKVTNCHIVTASYCSVNSGNFLNCGGYQLLLDSNIYCDWLTVSVVQLYSVVIGNGIDWLTVSGVQLYSVVIGNRIYWLRVSGVQLYSVVIGNGIDW
jgi:hypothetical protein